jgi:hypothetical protein
MGNSQKSSFCPVLLYNALLLGHTPKNQGDGEVICESCCRFFWLFFKINDTEMKRVMNHSEDARH